MPIVNDNYDAGYNRAIYVSAADGLLSNDSGAENVLPAQLASDYGVIWFFANGSFVYAPTDIGYVGPDSFEYTAVDNSSNVVGTATVTIDVKALPATPDLYVADGASASLDYAGAEQVVSLDATYAGDPAFPVALSNGNYVLGIVAIDETTFARSVYIQVFGPTGTPLPSGLIELEDNGLEVQNAQLDVIALEDGFVAAWRPDSDGSNPVDAPGYVQVFSNAGVAITAPIEVAPEGSGYLDFSSVGLIGLANGNFLATWREDEPDGKYFSIYDADGNVVAGRQLYDVAFGPVTLAADSGNGGFFAAHVEDVGDGLEIQVRRYDEDGNPAADPIVVREFGYGGFGITNLTVTAVNDDKFVVSWIEGLVPIEAVQTAHAQLVDAAGVPLGDEFVSPVNFNGTDPNVGSLPVSVLSLAEGYVVFWEHGVSPDRFSPDIFDSNDDIEPLLVGASAMVFDETGTAISGEILLYSASIATEFGRGQSPVRATALPDGGFAIVVKEIFGGTDGDVDSVIQVYDASGHRVIERQIVSATSDDGQYDAFIATLATGDIAVAWVDLSFDVDEDAEIHTQVFSLDTTFEAVEDIAFELPLVLDLNERFGLDYESTRVELTGLPAGSQVTVPAGMTATFAAGVWTITGTIPEAFSATVKLPADFNGEVDVLARLFTIDSDHVATSLEAASTPLAFHIEVAAAGEVILGTVRGDTINATKTVAGQHLPTLQDDTIFARAGNDSVAALAGDDQVFGQAGNDVLKGQGGDDLIVGGGGRDRLRGGPGDDTFRFHSVAEMSGGEATGPLASAGFHGAGGIFDRILDFVRGHDLVDLRSIDANTRPGATGNQAFIFIGGQDFHGKAGELHVGQMGGIVLLAGDTDGDRRADFTLAVAGPSTLGVGDLIL